MRLATQKELLKNIRDVNWDNILKNADPEHMTYYYELFCYSFDKGAEEMAKIKDMQIEKLVEALESASFQLDDDSPLTAHNIINEALADHKRMMEGE